MSVSDKKGKLNFPSFRFSPESEEMEEVKQKESPTESDTSISSSNNSIPTSPKPPPPQPHHGGDTSPLKEMLKQKWVNKWDKRSLSLDLDLKGKIRTAIEDKRKSIVSHFIPEETGTVIPGSIIAEYTAMPSPPGSIDDNYSDNFLGSGDLPYARTSSGLASSPSLNLRIQPYELPKSSASEPASPTTSGANFEEMGLDLAMLTQGDPDGLSEHVQSFAIPAEKLTEFYGESLALTSFRSEQTTAEDSISTRPLQETSLSIPLLISSMFWDVVSSGLSRWFIGLIAIAFGGTLWQILPFLTSFLWFFSGIFGSIIVLLAWTNPEARHNLPEIEKKEEEEPGAPPTLDCLASHLARTKALFPQSSHEVSIQGWMAEMDSNYDPFTHQLKMTRVVWVRLEGSTLYISHLHSKHRVPKRRLFNDAHLQGEIWFSRHAIYELSGAQVFIAPEQLAKKRIWSKKYPIGIRFPSSTDFPFTRTSILPKSDSTENLSNSNSSLQLSSVGEESSTTKEANGEEKSNNQSKDKEKDKKDSKGPKNTSPFNSRKREIRLDDYSGRVIYLFARADREKDIWFRRLAFAAKGGGVEEDSNGKSKSLESELIEPYLKFMKRIIPEAAFLPDLAHSNTSLAPKVEPKDEVVLVPEKREKSNSFSLKQRHPSIKDSPEISRKSTPTPVDNEEFSDIENILTIPASPTFLNAILGRFFFDFLRSPHWNQVVQGMIQKKLNYIKKPSVLDALLVKELDLGVAIPVIHKASSLVLDSQGLWVDLDITYEGHMTVALETKLNLMKLKKAPSMDQEEEAIPLPVGESFPVGSPTKALPERQRANLFDSDADDSGESSEEETMDSFEDELDFDGGKEGATTGESGSRGKRILKMAERIANSKYAEKMAEMGVVKKAIANVSSIALILSVTLKRCDGTLAINIPPPPGNIMWYGFRTNPTMEIVAKPKIGTRSVNVTHITEWLQRKLLHEFQRVVVLPNMDDLRIPLMDPFELPK